VRRENMFVPSCRGRELGTYLEPETVRPPALESRRPLSSWAMGFAGLDSSPAHPTHAAAPPPPMPHSTLSWMLAIISSVVTSSQATDARSEARCHTTLGRSMIPGRDHVAPPPQ